MRFCVLAGGSELRSSSRIPEVAADIQPSCSIFFHSFAASVAQSSIVIKSPKSLLARHAWQQLNIAIDIFETAGAGGAPVSMFCPRLRALRDTALLSLQNAQGVPLGMNTAQVSDFLAEGTDANLSILVRRRLFG